MRQNQRKRAEQRGRLAEALAALYLMTKFYRILARRVRTPLGEVDLVARRGRQLVFAEVKARRRPGEALYAVGPQSQRRIANAARIWLARHPGDAELSIRFDVIVMAPWRWPGHIAGAFDLSGKGRGI